jgi:hypothetical protein
MSGRRKKLPAGCRQPSGDDELAQEDAGGHNWSNLRLKNDLLPMVQGEGETSQDTLAHQSLITPYSYRDANHLPDLFKPLRKEGDSMPRKIVDLSARSRIIRDEPFHVHFWESTPAEFLEFLRNPRMELAQMGIRIPDECRIETTIENHDWLSQHTNGLTAARGTIVCNVGGGNVARTVYRVVSYAHDQSTVGQFQKDLLHSPDEEEYLPKP